MWINGVFFLAGKLRNLFPVLLSVVQAKDWQSAWSSCWRLLYAWAWNLRGCSIRYLNNICKEQEEEERWLWKLEEGWPCLCWYSTSVFTSLLHVWPVGLLTRTLTPASAAATMLVGSSYPIHYPQLIRFKICSKTLFGNSKVTCLQRVFVLFLCSYWGNMKENLCNRSLHEELGELLACYIPERRSWVTDSGDESITRSVKRCYIFIESMWSEDWRCNKKACKCADAKLLYQNNCSFGKLMKSKKKHVGLTKMRFSFVGLHVCWC